MPEVEAKSAEQSPEEKQLIRSIGRALWRTEVSARATVEEKRASWSEGRRKYMHQARKLMRTLGMEGVAVNKAEAEK